MGDVILFACGGAAGHIFTEANESPDVPTVFLNVNRSSTIQLTDADVPGARADPFLASSLLSDNREAICAKLHGMRVAVVFAVLGGGSGTGMMPEVAQYAREEGCHVVSFVGIPMEFERERRERAKEALADVLGISDRMFILDMEYINRIYPDVKFHHILNKLANTISFSVRSMAHLMEGPFFSTFSRKVYTVAYTTDMLPTNAVARAAEASMFPVDPAFGKSVVMVSSGFGTAQMESIFNTVVSMTGIVPDIVKREDGDDTKVLTFLPVQGF